MLDRKLFLSLAEARVVLDQWRIDYKRRRSHGGLNWMNPGAFVASLDDTVTDAVPMAPLGVSPVGATPSRRPRSGLVANPLIGTETQTKKGQGPGSTIHARPTIRDSVDPRLLYATRVTHNTQRVNLLKGHRTLPKVHVARDCLQNLNADTAPNTQPFVTVKTIV